MAILANIIVILLVLVSICFIPQAVAVAPIHYVPVYYYYPVPILEDPSGAGQYSLSVLHVELAVLRICRIITILLIPLS